MKKFIAIALAVLTAVMVFAFAGCGDKKAEVLKVGITEYPPMNFKDENGEWTGFDTELTLAFAEKIGMDVEFIVLTDWDKKFIELKAGTIDCVWNGMTITEEGRKNADISDVYLKNSQVVVLPADKSSPAKTVEDLKGLTFAVENGSAGQSIAEKNGLKVTAVQDMGKALLEVKSGACDGAIIDQTMAEATVGEGTSYANLAVAMTLSTEEFGVAFRQGSELTAQFNEFLKEYNDNGKFAELAAKYEIQIEK
jgi:polar amino acid transport system substrate-binding protein